MSNRFNELLISQFKDCSVLLEVEDRGRQRSVKVFDLGRKDLVGLCDGIDSWVAAPGSVFIKFDIPSLLTVKVRHRGHKEKTDHEPLQQRAGIQRRRLLSA